VNKVILMGRLTRDPEVRYSNSAEPVAVARFALAVNRRFKRDGEADADFINCVAFGKTGEFVEKYFKKGQMVAVTGRLQVNKVEDAQTKQNRYFTDVIAEEAYFAESKASFQNRTGGVGGAAQYDYTEQAEAAAKHHSKHTEQPQAVPDGFFAADDSLDDEDLPF
jgi:single-strand DNA-binding protein